jgi:hypothetical protein
MLLGDGMSKKRNCCPKTGKGCCSLACTPKSTRCKKRIPTISTQAHDRSMVVRKAHHLTSHLPNPKNSLRAQTIVLRHWFQEGMKRRHCKTLYILYTDYIWLINACCGYIFWWWKQRIIWTKNCFREVYLSQVWRENNGICAVYLYSISLYLSCIKYFRCQ